MGVFHVPVHEVCQIINRLKKKKKTGDADTGSTNPLLAVCVRLERFESASLSRAGSASAQVSTERLMTEGFSSGDSK